MLLNGLVTAVATLGVGKLPKAPGTWGSALALLVWWALFPLNFWLQVTLIVCAFFIGWVATHFYEKWNNKHDPKEVVIDELIGMWIAVLFLPAGSEGIFLWNNLLLGFLFFRIFDIWKPFPIGWIDKNVPGALGTILDDVVAGLFAWFWLWGVLFYQFGTVPF